MKVSLYFQDELWSKFKRNVLRRTGDSKALSSEVQSLLRDSLIEESIRAGFESMQIEIKPMSSNQIVAIKPSISTSSGVTLKNMRQSRLGKAVSR
jgi:hypothetical protein